MKVRRTKKHAASIAVQINQWGTMLGSKNMNKLLTWTSKWSPKPSKSQPWPFEFTIIREKVKTKKKLQILSSSWFSLWENNTQNEHTIAHFEYFFTFHYSKAVWLVENLNEIKINHYEKIFSHIKQKFSHFENGLGIKNIFLSHWDDHYFHRDACH